MTGPNTRATCGEWPYLIIEPTQAERSTERVYADGLAFFEREGRIAFEIATRGFPDWGFFAVGERVQVLRPGDESRRHMLVRVRNDRAWTVRDELCR